MTILAPIIPGWPAPSSVRSLFTTRQGGSSSGPWGDAQGRGGLNLGANCGDEPASVALNRALLGRHAGTSIRWLDQVHGTQVLEVAETDTGVRPGNADAQVTTIPGIGLAVLVADCLPVLLADRGGSIIGVAHAGWRGLAAGVLENTIGLMRRRRPDADVIAWLGPCIGPSSFEVGADVLDAFASRDPQDAVHFRATARPGKWWADLPGLAAQRLGRLGVSSVTRSDACTVTEGDRFWSYRRDGACGRMAGIIWLQG